MTDSSLNAWHSTAFPTPKHERVHGLLRRLVSEGVAAFFGDACSISLIKPPFRTSIHLVSHLMREVESGLRQVLLTLPATRSRRANLDEAPKKTKERCGQDGEKNHRLEILAITNTLGLSGRTADEWLAYTKGEGRAGPLPLTATIFARRGR